MLRLDELRMQWKVVASIIVSTTLLIIDYYHRLLPVHPLDRMLLYFVVPMLIILLVYRDRPADYGFRVGDWRSGLLITFAACAVITVVIWFIAQSEAFRGYYKPLSETTLPVPVYAALDLFGWEFLFRGFLLFSLYAAVGPYAIVLQAVPFALAHIGKPELETLSTIFGGSAFGYIAWRTGSFLYPFLIHWFLLTVTIMFASLEV
jgi:membrane protease YdiL (CAAX protease family)